MDRRRSCAAVLSGGVWFVLFLQSAMAQSGAAGIQGPAKQDCELAIGLGEPVVDPADTATMPVFLTTCQGQLVDALQLGLVFDATELSATGQRGAATAAAEYMVLQEVTGGAVVVVVMKLAGPPFITLPANTPDQEVVVVEFRAKVAGQVSAAVSLSRELGDPPSGIGVSIGEEFVSAAIAGTGTVSFTVVGGNAPPIADPGGPYEPECACATPLGTRVALDGSRSVDPDGDPITFTWTGPFAESPASGVKPTVTLADGCEGTYQVTLVVSDGKVDSEPAVAVITVADTKPPALKCPPNQVKVADPNTGTVPASEVDIPSQAQDDCAGAVSVASDAPDIFQLGTTTVTCTVADPAGNQAECSFDVIVKESAGVAFIRGDFNADGCITFADVRLGAKYAVQKLVRTSPGIRPCAWRPRWRAELRPIEPLCLDAADANDDGAVDICDPIFTLMSLFCAAPPIPEPFPACGEDPTEDELGCESFPPCKD